MSTKYSCIVSKILGGMNLREPITIAILISNVISGGTYRHARELVQNWYNNGYRVLLVTIVGKITRITVYYNKKNMQEFFLYEDTDCTKLEEILFSYRTSILHIEHLFNTPPAICELHKRLKCSLIVTLHDYYFICPFIKLVNEDGVYCEEHDCDRCLERRTYFSSTLGTRIKNIDAWRNFWCKYLLTAHKIIVPSEDMYIRISAYYPNLKIYIMENPELIQYRSSVRRIGLIGELTVEKGAKKIKDVLRICVDKDLPVHFILFGTLKDINLTKEERTYIDLLGPYEEHNVYRDIQEKSIDFFWFPGVWPETYSYTLSIPVRLRIPCLSTDLGAISSRIQKHRWGDVYSWRANAEEIISRLLNFPFSSYYNKDFTIQNIRFDDFSLYYSTEVLSCSNDIKSNRLNLAASSFDALQSKLENYTFRELLKKLNGTFSGIEFSFLWTQASFFFKMYLLKHIDFLYYYKILRNLGIKGFFYKLKNKM